MRAVKSPVKGKPITSSVGVNRSKGSGDENARVAVHQGVSVDEAHPLEFSVRGHAALLLLWLIALAFKSVIFAPLNWWPLSFVCLVPWLLMVGACEFAPRVYWHSFLFGLVYFLINVRWMYPATGYGYVALAAYLAVYFPLMACSLRHALRRRRLPMGIAFPIVWTGCEMLRAVVISGFPWFFLSHSLSKVLTLIQVSDLVGAYGVSFLVASFNGFLLDALIDGLNTRCIHTHVRSRLRLFRRQTVTGAVTVLLLLLAVVVYGQYRLNQSTITPGPRVAVIQGDYVNTIDGKEVDDLIKMQTYFSILEDASKENADLYLLPETPWIMYLNEGAREFFRLSQVSYDAFQQFCRVHQTYVITGSASLDLTPHDLVEKERRYNSAMVFSPDGKEPDRYDKVHVVPFGEAVPFRYGRLRFLYFWMNSLMPFSGRDGTYEFSLFPGKSFKTFVIKAKSQSDKSYRVGVPICYEDVMPYVSRRFAFSRDERKRVNLLFNISNDGWFGHGIQQPQHLAICVFRAVENRVGIVRSVNTGISGFIDPDGRRHDLVKPDEKNHWGKNAGFSAASVGVDSRVSYYSAHGDWFAWSCVLLWLVLFVDYWIIRVREKVEH